MPAGGRLREGNEKVRNFIPKFQDRYALPQPDKVEVQMLIFTTKIWQQELNQCLIYDKW
jgi:hypothetical protein